MYLVELIIRWIFPNKKYEPRKKFDPFAHEDIDTPQECEHMFLPIDSSGETFACTKCGLLAKKEELKDKNIFKKRGEN